MGGVIDLNTDNDDDDDDVVALVEGASPTLSLSSPSLTSSSSASACFSTSTATLPVCLELWHANAGPLISLLRKGNVVVYLLQGHLEQMPDFPAVVYELPPHVFCRVVDVKLHAEVPSNEVFAQISLVPESELWKEQRQGRVFEGWNEGKIYFPPTYKYSNNSDRYAGDDMHPGEKRRTPAW